MLSRLQRTLAAASPSAPAGPLGGRVPRACAPVAAARWHQRQPRRSLARAASAAQGSDAASARSFDGEDDLDYGPAAELSAAADPERLQKMARRLELVWQIARTGRPQACDCCKGQKEVECEWCHATGYLTVGDQVLTSNSLHSSTCPVCRGTGYCKCENCRGTGFRAAWLGSSSGGGFGSSLGLRP